MSSDTDESESESESVQITNKLINNQSKGEFETNKIKKSTKDMIQEALNEDNSRKGVSYQAIKKYINDTYKVDMNKFKYLIKRQLRSAVEEGTIRQTKGSGASGSFKLIVKIQKKKDTTGKPAQNAKEPAQSKTKEKTSENVKISIKETKKSGDKLKKTVTIQKKTVEKVKKTKKIETKSTEGVKGSKKKNETEKNEKKTKAGTSKDPKTPSKTRDALMKRKSIGSIRKPPKMKPKAK